MTSLKLKLSEVSLSQPATSEIKLFAVKREQTLDACVIMARYNKIRRRS